MTLPLTTHQAKEQLTDLIKTICALLLFPRLDQFNKNNLRHAVERLVALAQDEDLHVDCRFEQDGTGDTKIILQVTVGARSGSTN